MASRRLGLVLLYLGFFGSAFFTVRSSDSLGAEWATIEWGWYGVMFAIGLIGLVLFRTSPGSAGALRQKLETDLITIQTSLDSIVAKLGRIQQDRQTIGVYDVHSWIDDSLVEDLSDFVEAREAMIQIYGLQQYADVMSRFALGERNVNRAWSASADGYIDEVWRSVDQAEGEMAAAKSLLAEFRER